MPSTLGIVSSQFVPTSGDPFWNNTALLLQGEGLNAAQNNTFIDSTGINTITRVGTPTQGSFSPFPIAALSAYNPLVNGGSGYFASGNYLTLSPSSTFAVGTGDFTAESWIYIPDSSSTVRNLWGNLRWNMGYQSGWSVYVWSDNTIRLRQGGTVNTWDELISTTAVSPNTWAHIAISRNAGTMRLFINGVLQTSKASTWNYTGAESFKIGATWIDGIYSPSNVYISDLRVVNPSLYTSTFTRPTSPLTNVTGTSLLCNFTNAGIFDSVAKNDLVTVGNAQVSTAVKKFGTGSMYFDGTNSYLASTIPRADWKFLHDGTTNWTVEGWFYTGSTAQQTILNTDSASKDVGMSIIINNLIERDLSVQIFRGVTGSIFNVSTSSNVWNLNTWTHFAATFASSTKTLKLYINGTNVGSLSNPSYSFSSSNPTYDMNIGRSYYSGGAKAFFNGYIDDFRITKGIARYTADFTPPSYLPNFG